MSRTFMLKEAECTAAFLLLAAAALAASCAPGPRAPTPASGPLSQFPSPMSESVRAHARVEARDIPGRVDTVRSVLPAPVEVFVPAALEGRVEVDLLVHFHGAAYVVRDAAARAGMIGATIMLGAGSSVYERPFSGTGAFEALLDSARAVVRPALLRRVVLSSWSAGYGAIRAILRDHAPDVFGVLLLDGLHTDYVPDGVRLADGGSLNGEKMIPFEAFARRAAADETRMIVTHSEIFPGTYASTTETAQWLADALGVERRAVVGWGPRGMQALVEARSGRLAILGFAGNTAPDHVDHLHGLAAFLEALLGE